MIHNRTVFHRQKQNSGESVEQFVRELLRLAEGCNFTSKDEAIRDMFVVGITDAETSKKLQLLEKLTLQEAVKQARQAEEVDQQMKLLHEGMQATKSFVSTISKLESTV